MERQTDRLRAKCGEGSDRSYGERKVRSQQVVDGMVDGDGAEREQ